MLTAELPGTGGHIKAELDDFCVEEVPSYLPSGAGEHIMVLIRKRGLTTEAVARTLARAADVSNRDIGFAGRKDKQAVTTQWFSLPAKQSPEAILELEDDVFEVLEAKRHGNKLRTGHLRGNRFRVVVRGVVSDAEARARAILEVVGREGFPNSFGPQRFGRDGRNPERALDWIVGGKKPPKNKQHRRLFVSALQAIMFNQLVERRIAAGRFSRPLPGDVMKKTTSGGMFVADDAVAVEERMRAGEVSPTGPIFGARMWWPEAEALALEEQLLADCGLTRDDLARFKKDGKGTRRVLRVFPDDPTVSQADDQLTISFGLEAGAFATTLLAEITKAEELVCPTALPQVSR